MSENVMKVLWNENGAERVGTSVNGIARNRIQKVEKVNKGGFSELFSLFE
jgi:hypothetical protein